MDKAHYMETYGPAGAPSEATTAIWRLINTLGVKLVFQLELSNFHFKNEIGGEKG